MRWPGEINQAMYWLADMLHRKGYLLRSLTIEDVRPATESDTYRVDVRRGVRDGTWTVKKAVPVREIEGLMRISIEK